MLWGYAPLPHDQSINNSADGLASNTIYCKHHADTLLLIYTCALRTLRVWYCQRLCEVQVDGMKALCFPLLFTRLA